MAIDFPNSPSSGDIYTVNGKQWQWDGEKWIAYGVSLAPDVLKVDTGNNRVGINQLTPTVALDVTGSARITGDLTVTGTTVTVDSATILIKDRVSFEGATADEYETVLLATDPTADRTITLPNATGTVALTSTVLPLAGGAMTGAITTNSTFDGIDVATRDGVLTSTTSTANAALPKAGGAMTGAITTNSTFDGIDIAVRDAVLTSTTTTANAALPKAGGTLSGAVDAGEQIISQAIFKDVGETLATNGTSGSAATISLADGNFHKVTMTANCTFTFSNVPATANTAASFTLFLVQDGTGSRIATWPGTVDWAAATAPTLTTTAAAVDVLTFITLDGGTVWNGFVAGQAMG